MTPKVQKSGKFRSWTASRSSLNRSKTKRYRIKTTFKQHFHHSLPKLLTIIIKHSEVFRTVHGIFFLTLLMVSLITLQFRNPYSSVLLEYTVIHRILDNLLAPQILGTFCFWYETCYSSQNNGN